MEIILITTEPPCSYPEGHHTLFKCNLNLIKKSSSHNLFNCLEWIHAPGEHDPGDYFSLRVHQLKKHCH